MDWGWDDAPHPRAEGRAYHSELERDRLPEVRELTQLGWTLVHEVPTWYFKPFVWPAHARTWVPDRSTMWSLETCMDGEGSVTSVRRQPCGEEELAELEAEINRELVAVGVPERPRGRLWLLRPVGGFPSMETLTTHVLTIARERGIDQACPELVKLWATELSRLDG